MKEQKIYYLRKNQKLLITPMKPNARAIILDIDDGLVRGKWIDYSDFNMWGCMAWEFDKIFKTRK